MTENSKTAERRPKQSSFDFTKSISQLFIQPGGRDFALRLILWASVCVGIVFFLLAGPYVEYMSVAFEASWLNNQSNGNSTDALALYASLGSVWVKMIIGFVALWLIYVSAETALHKRILQGVDYGFFPLRFGRDELRVLYVQFAVFMCVMCFIFLSVIGFTIIMILGNMIGGGVLMTVLGGIVYITMIWAWLYFAIRLAPASALSILTGQTRVHGGWALTKKRTGYLFLAYLFITIVGYVFMSIGQMVIASSLISENYMFVVMGMSEENPRILFEQAAEKLSEPAVVIKLIIGGILYILSMVIWSLSYFGVANYAVQWWVQDQSVQDSQDP